MQQVQQLEIWSDLAEIFGEPEKLRKFRVFHENNPHVFMKLRALALDLKQRGLEKYSIKGLYEVVRWQYAFEYGKDEQYRLNNNYTAYYARLLMEAEPDLKGFFSLRTSGADVLGGNDDQ